MDFEIEMASTSPMTAIAIAPLKTSFMESILNCTILKEGRVEGIAPVSFTPFFSNAKNRIKKIGTIIPINAPGILILILLQIKYYCNRH